MQPSCISAVCFFTDSLRAELSIHIYLKGRGIEDTIKLEPSRLQTEGSGRRKQRTKPPSSSLSLAFFARCLSHPFVPQQQLRPVCSPLSALAASLCSSAAAERDECLCVARCVCMHACNYSFQSQRPPLLLSIPTPITHTGRNTSLLFILKVGQSSRGLFVSSNN